MSPATDCDRARKDMSELLKSANVPNPSQKRWQYIGAVIQEPCLASSESLTEIDNIGNKPEQDD